MLKSWIGTELDVTGRTNITMEELQYLIGARGASKALSLGYISEDLSVKSIKDYLELSDDFLSQHDYLAFVEAKRLLNVTNPMFSYLTKTHFIRTKVSEIDVNNHYNTEDLLRLKQMRESDNSVESSSNMGTLVNA